VSALSELIQIISMILNKIISISFLVISIIFLLIDLVIIIETPYLAIFFYAMLFGFVLLHLPIFIFEFNTYRRFAKTDSPKKISSGIKKLVIFFTVFQLLSYTLIFSFYIPVIQLYGAAIIILGGFIVILTHVILIALISNKLKPHATQHPIS
jgi:hypothetical protein